MRSSPARFSLCAFASSSSPHCSRPSAACAGARRAICRPDEEQHCRDQKKRQLRQSWHQAITPSTLPAIYSVAGRPSSCEPISSPARPAEDARVSTMPPATETSSEGIIVTRPSPTVSMV